MASRKLLIVDDERMILETLETIFRQHGYHVVSAATVADPLLAISRERFDVLIADLNIGQPGDGFTVVSALRRTQPDSIALILTGYPAFDSALQAIREQVDDFLVKPIHPLDLVQKVESTVHTRKKHVPVRTKRISDILSSERETILRSLLAWLRKTNCEAGVRKISDDGLLNNLPVIVDELCRCVDVGDVTVSAAARSAAESHGRLRAEQGLDFMFLCDESTVIRKAVLGTIHRNLMLLNMSTLFLDLTLMSDSLDEQWKISAGAFLAAQAKAA